MNFDERIELLQKGARAAKISTCVTVILTALKGAAGFLSGSIALLADAVHSLSDIFTSLAVWSGLKLSQRPASERFPYGFYRVETLTFLLVSVIVAASGAQILVESFNRMLTPHVASLTSFTLFVAALSALVSWSLCRYKSRASRETGSQALLGEARHSIVDLCSSALVFVGILLRSFGISSAESMAGLLIGVLIIWLGVRMARDAILVLLDACLKPELISQMRKIANEVDGVKGVHDIKARKSGPFMFGEMHIELDSAMSVEKAARISGTIEHNVRRSMQQVDSLLIHTEPSKKEMYRIAIPVEHDKGLNSEISEHLGKSPFFIFVDLHDDNLVSWFVVENPAASLDKKRGIEAAHLLVRHKADALVTREVGEGPYHVLKDSSIQVLALNQKSEIRHVLDAFSRRELRILVPSSKQA